MRFLAVMLQKKPDYLEQKQLSLKCCIQENADGYHFKGLFLFKEDFSFDSICIQILKSMLADILGRFHAFNRKHNSYIFGYECRELL